MKKTYYIFQQMQERPDGAYELKMAAPGNPKGGFVTEQEAVIELGNLFESDVFPYCLTWRNFMILPVYSK